MAKYTDPVINITSNWLNGSDNWDAENNTNLTNIRALLLSGVEGISNNVASPVNGDLYIVGATGTGDFVGEDGNLAFYRGATDGWVFSPPAPYNIKYDKTTKEYMFWTGTEWKAHRSQGSRIVSADVTGTVTLDMSVSSNFISDGATGDITLAFANPPALGLLNEVTYIFVQDATGGRTLSFPVSVVWAGGIAPTVSSGADEEDEFRFSTRDAGNTWRGFVVGQNIS